MQVPDWSNGTPRVFEFAGEMFVFGVRSLAIASCGSSSGVPGKPRVFTARSAPSSYMEPRRCV